MSTSERRRDRDAGSWAVQGRPGRARRDEQQLRGTRPAKSEGP